MICPHCNIAFHSDNRGVERHIGEDADGGWIWIRHHCPACSRFILHLVNGTAQHDTHGSFTGLLTDEPDAKELRVIRAWPQSDIRRCPPEVPDELAEDFREASAVLPFSAKASAALSRRCLQNLLRETAKVKHADLAKEIQEVLDRHTLPAHLADAIDGVRNVGNFAAHPIKSTTTGDVLPVEFGEAEWNLNTLESLFDFYFVAPAATQRRRDALNAKLKDAGKPPMK